MVDLGFVGPKFSWSNLQSLSRLIMERLDRALANTNWKVLFPNNMVSNLSRMSSNHCPILMDTNSKDSPPPRRFRFESMWLSHSNFQTVVSSSWGPFNDSPVQAIQACANALSSWNRNVFGNLFKKKRHIQTRIKGT
ncbi:hypothetical protein CFOL_v3_13795 [Cephalotus follicularis]|uniref:Exo_endo_phos domain-containing protein n=1 Tax=Cephalotus follicularis TaxID=3775 RepID=A0A1Q3BQG0_CEPFO|nr:hypothetical protein CFOL_v3_13795 [Cephalotus follicularis]